MGEHERMLIRLGKIIDQIARPHRCDEAVPVDLRASLWQMGVPCDDLSTREELVVRLWARKRSLMIAIQPEWGGPGVTPPSAA